MKTPIVDRAEIVRALSAIIAPGQVVELRALEAVTAQDRRPHVESGYFDDAEKLADAAASIGHAKGIYFTPNPINPALLARAANRIRAAGKEPLTTDADITGRRWLLVDIDPTRPAGISSTDAEHNAAVALARRIADEWDAEDWPRPIIGDSGNGAHLLYRVDLPADDGGLVERLLKVLAAKYDGGGLAVDTSVHNPARIWKLYGTWAAKGDSTPERPHRMARLLEIPDTLLPVPTHRLEELAGPAPEPELTREHRHATDGRGIDLAEWLRANNVPVGEPKPWKGGGTIYTFDVCPFNPSHTGGSAWAGQLPSGALAAGCQHQSCGWGWAELRAKYETVRVQAATPKPQATRQQRIVLARPFPTEALPDPLAGFVKAAAVAIGCDDSYIALPLLAALASAIGNTRRIMLKRGWTEPAVLWAALMADSGTLKSPGQDVALAAIRRRQAVLLKDHKAAMAEYERELQAWKETPRNERGDRPETPAPVEHVYCSDVTIEALAARLEASPRGILVMVDELSAWFGSFDRYASGGGDVAHWLSLHRAGGLKVDRKTAERPTIYVPHAAVSIAGGIQPKVLRRALGTEHFSNGLAARLLLAWPERRTKHWTEATVDDELQRQVDAVFDELWKLQPEQDANNEIRPADVPLAIDGHAAWVRFYEDFAQEQARLSGDLAAAASKLEGYAARLALIVHQVRHAAGEQIDPWQVDGRSIASGVMLVRWFYTEARRVYGVLSETDAEAARRELVDFIRSRGGRVTVRDLTHGTRRYHRTEDAQAALDAMVEGGAGRWSDPAPGPKGGRPTRVFILSDAVTVTETSADDSASGGIGYGDGGTGGEQ